MPSSIDFAAEFFSLQAEHEELICARDDLPDGAHIRSLFQLAIVRIEERMMTLQRSNAAGDPRIPHRFDAAA